MQPNGQATVKDRVIVSKINAAANCEIPQCVSCNLSRARQHTAKVVKSKAIKSELGAISRDKYVPGNVFVNGSIPYEGAWLHAH